MNERNTDPKPRVFVCADYSDADQLARLTELCQLLRLANWPTLCEYDLYGTDREKCSDNQHKLVNNYITESMVQAQLVILLNRAASMTTCLLAGAAIRRCPLVVFGEPVPDHAKCMISGYLSSVAVLQEMIDRYDDLAALATVESRLSATLHNYRGW